MAGSKHQKVAIGNLTLLHSGFCIFPWANFTLRQASSPGAINPAKDSHWHGLSHMSIPEPITEAQGNAVLSLARLGSCVFTSLGFILFSKYLLSTYSVLDTVLDPGDDDTAVN